MTGKEAAAKAKPSVMRALEIDDTLAEAHNALAEIMYQLEYDWIGAAKEFERAIELNPNVASIRLAYGWFLMTNGRFDESDIEMETARTLGPTSLVIGEGKGNLFYFSRQYDRALEHYQMALTAEPDLPTSYFHLAEIYEQKRMYVEAVDAYLKATSLRGDPPENIEQAREAFKSSGWSGYLRKRVELGEARFRGKSLSPYQLAALHAKVGQKDEAFALLEQGFEERDPFLVRIKTTPTLDSLRDDPRFIALMKKIGFPE